jgi:dTDP-glucose 4,6-dehydratase
MRLFVTGGAGFIGSAFIREAARRRHSVLNIDLLTYAGDIRALESVPDHDAYRFVRADISDHASMQDLVRDFEPDTIVNFAAESHVDRSIDDPAVFLKTNVLGTFVLLDVATAYWSTRDPANRERFRFVQISTDEVFGSLAREGVFSESSRYAPNSPYSASKAAGDHLAAAWHNTYGLPAIVSNCTNNYGPYQHAEKLIPTILRNALADQPIPIYGSGENRRDWLYVEDHVDGLFRLIDRGHAGEAYIFGSGTDVPNIEVAQKICKLLDARRPRARESYCQLITLVADRPGHDFRYAVDTGKARSALGWSPKMILDAGLAETVDWYLSNPEWLTRDGRGLGRLGLSHMSRGA